MTALQYRPTLLTALACATVLACRPAEGRGGTPPSGGGSGRVALTQALPPLNGRALTVTVVEVTYGPGDSSKPHRHPCPVIGYVVQGALRSQVLGGPAAVYRAGDTFYEAPNGVHLVSANASDRDSVRFLAYFTCDRKTPLSMPVDTAAAPGPHP